MVDNLLLCKRSICSTGTGKKNRARLQDKRSFQCCLIVVPSTCRWLAEKNRLHQATANEHLLPLFLPKLINRAGMEEFLDSDIFHFRTIAIPIWGFMDHEFNTSCISDKQLEMYFINGSSCYRYHEASQITRDIASGTVCTAKFQPSIKNSPLEWLSLLKLPLNSSISIKPLGISINDIDECGAFNERRLLIGQQ